MIKTYINGVLQESGGSVALRHNQLIGLNDDVNFQHITSADRTKLNNLSGTNTGDETASTIITKIGDGSKINSNYLPSYVDDVLEFANVASFPVTGEVGKIYIALDVNLTYRWGGSSYIEISPSIALGETSATAYRGDRGKIAYDHSQLTSGTNPHNTTFANIASKPTTITGYGITDGVTLTDSQTLTNKTLTSPVLNTEVTGTAVTTTGEANKLLKFSSVANTLLHFLRIRKSSTTALNVQDDSSVDVFNVDTTNKVATSYNQKISSLAGTGTRMVVADASGNLSATTMAYSEDTYTPTLSATEQVGEWGYSSSWGKYAIVGKKITIFINIIWTAKPSAGADIKISLPYSLEVRTIRGFLSEYSGITFAGKQLALTNNGEDTANAYIYQSMSDSLPVSMKLSDISSSGYLLGVIEGMLS